MSSKWASTNAFIFFRGWSRKPLRVASVTIQVEAILSGAYEHLVRDGAFYQFT